MERFGDIARDAGCKTGLRVNPGYSKAMIGGALYDPCAPGSRFGEVASKLDQVDWSKVDIFHVHSLCEALDDGSVGLINHVAGHFAPYLEQVSAVNFGGGHLIGRDTYDTGALIAAIKAFKARFNVEVILEPGAGLVIDAGELHTSVLALHRNEIELAIVDASASTHMPDILEAPYRPNILGAGEPDELAHTYTLGGKTCMTGDVIGTYSFPERLKIGQRLILADQMHYTFVKTTMFNGTPLADIALRDETGDIRTIAEFDYSDFRERLGASQLPAKKKGTLVSLP